MSRTTETAVPAIRMILDGLVIILMSNVMLTRKWQLQRGCHLYG